MTLSTSLVLSLAAVGCESSSDDDGLASTESDAATESKLEDASDNKSDTQKAQTKSEEDKASAAKHEAESRRREQVRSTALCIGHGRVFR